MWGGQQNHWPERFWMTSVTLVSLWNSPPSFTKSTESPDESSSGGSVSTQGGAWKRRGGGDDKDSSKKRYVQNTNQVEEFKIQEGESWKNNFCGKCVDACPMWKGSDKIKMCNRYGTRKEITLTTAKMVRATSLKTKYRRRRRSITPSIWRRSEENEDQGRDLAVSDPDEHLPGKTFNHRSRKRQPRKEQLQVPKREGLWVLQQNQWPTLWPEQFSQVNQKPQYERCIRQQKTKS